MASNPNKTDVFQFMSVRSPQSVEPKILRYFYIQDVEFGLNLVRKTRDVFSENSSSEIGKMLFKEIFYEAFPPKPTPPPIPTTVVGKNNEIIKQVLSKLDSITVDVADKGDLGSFANNIGQSSYITIDPPDPLSPADKTTYYLIPDQLDNCFDLKHEPRYAVVIQIINDLRRLLEIHTKNFDKNGLINAIKALNGNATKPLYLFSFGIQDTPESILSDITILRAKLFDALYTLYILRRIASIDLEHIIKALQTLHILEWLAFDEFLTLANNNQLPQSDNLVTAMTKLLQESIDELKAATFTPGTITFSFIKTKQDLIKYFEAAPIIHPVVAKLHWFRHPFNEIKPIGIGDLKVVKQWLCGYKAGEISHIHNIMKSEIKERTHRHLEKSEDVFSFSSEQSEDTQRENQTTERFEMKREAEKAIKTDLNIGANANFTYKNQSITASVGATFAYANSNQDTQRSSSNYAREMMDKAVTQVQNKTTQNRSSTKIFETEETNKHGFDNTKAGATHISGIYRWLDKRYKAQLYNYGKRLMFEFIIPEPAAFYVESKLKAVEFEIDVPVKPLLPKSKSVKVLHPTEKKVDGELKDLSATDIDETTFNALKLTYNLTETTYPTIEKRVMCLDRETGKSVFSKSYGDSKNKKWVSDHYEFQIADKGFCLVAVDLFGQARFWDQAGEATDTYEFEKNRFTLYINGQEVGAEFEFGSNPELLGGVDDLIATDSLKKGYSFPLDKTIDVTDGSISIDIAFQDVSYYDLSILLKLKFAPKHLDIWRTKVYKEIQDIERKKVDKINQENEIAYNAAMTEYHNKLNELNAQAINDLIQGRSEAFNRQIIREELKKHCLAMIAKEFDSDNSDDIISKEYAIADEPTVEIVYDKFEAGERLEGAIGKEELTPFAEFSSFTKEVNYHKINIDVAKKQAKFVQFLEQAFEWQQIAYVFYPYFWAHEKKWITLMNRLDYTDNNMTAFLKAGSVRVLIAATPGYNDAVMHFLSTREPWEGGSLPVIGDPLFIPVYEEIRKQQDDLQNATPEGEAWEFEVPTSLIYLHDSSSPLPTDLKCDEDKETGETDDNTQETPNIFSCLGQLATCLCFHLRKGVISGYKQIFPE